MTHYSNILRLDFDPFEPGAVSRDFFAGGGRQQLLDHLTELSLYSDAIIGVTGCLGSGKTTLAANLCASYDDEALCVLIPATLFMNAEQFLDQLISELPLKAGGGLGEESSIDEICQLAAHLDMEARSIILLVDDAHELGSEVVDVMVELLQRSAESSFHVILFGEQQLVNLLRSTLPSSRLEQLEILELEGFGSDESLQYVKFKLDTAGFNQLLPIDAALLGAIHNESNGVPGTLHAMTADALNASIVTAAVDLDNGSVATPSIRYWTAAAVLVLALISMLVIWDAGELETPVVTADAGPSDELERVQIAVAVSPETVTRQEMATAAPQATATVPPVGEAIVEPVPGVDPAAEPGAAPAALATADEAPLLDNEAPSTSPAVVEAEPLGISQQAQTAPSESTELVAEDEFERELLSYPAANYVVQLLGARSETNVRQFVDDLRLDYAHGYFETRYQNQPWYVVVVGNFENRADATQAIGQLPEPLRSLQPWIRPMRGIQADIRQLSPVQLANP